MRPKEIALALGKSDGTTRKLLFDMKGSGQVKETGQGYVALLSGNTNSHSSDKILHHRPESRRKSREQKRLQQLIELQEPLRASSRKVVTIR